MGKGAPQNDNWTTDYGTTRQQDRGRRSEVGGQKTRTTGRWTPDRFHEDGGWRVRVARGAEHKTVRSYPVEYRLRARWFSGAEPQRRRRGIVVETI
jgi:hypothetical protein